MASVPTSFTSLSTTAADNYPGGSDNVFPSLDDTLRVHAACLASIKANTATNDWVSPYLPNATALVYNDAGADVDARFEGVGDANLVYLDAGNARVGIGTATPSVKFEVSGAAKVGGAFTVTGNTTLGDAGTDTVTTNGNVTISAPSSGVAATINGVAGTNAAHFKGTDSGVLFGNAAAANYLQIYYQSSTVKVEALGASDSLVLATNGGLRQTISANGNVTINAPDSGYGLNIPTGTPASAGAAGTAGDICWDADYLYVCTATNTWKRVSIAPW